MAGVKGRSGGRRIGAGRKPQPRPAPSIAEVAPALHAELAGIRTLIERTLKTQSADIARLQQQRRDGNEHGPLILRRLTELERLVRGDGGLTKPARHTRGRPLGVDT
jgi:hypothetical protein